MVGRPKKYVDAQGYLKSGFVSDMVRGHAAGYLHTLRLPKYKLSKLFDAQAARARAVGLHVPNKRDLNGVGTAVEPGEADDSSVKLAAWLGRCCFDARAQAKQAKHYSLRLPSGCFEKEVTRGRKSHGLKPAVTQVLCTFARLWKSSRLQVVGSHGLGVKALKAIGSDEALPELSGIIDKHTALSSFLCDDATGRPGTLCGSLSVVNAACKSCANIEVEFKASGDVTAWTCDEIEKGAELRWCYRQHEEGAQPLRCSCGRLIVA